MTVIDILVEEISIVAKIFAILKEFYFLKIISLKNINFSSNFSILNTYRKNIFFE